MIKRYEESASGVLEDDEGTYCNFYDYEALEAENAKLQQLLDEAVDKKIDEYEVAYEQLKTERDRYKAALEEIAESDELACRIAKQALGEKE